MKRKSIFGIHIFSMLILVLIIVGCSEETGNASEDDGNSESSEESNMEQIVLKVGHVFGADHPWNVSLEGLSEDVAEATDGNVEIEVYPSSQLGGDRDMAEGIQMGTIEMGLFGTGALQSLDERLIVEELPYAWPTREHAYNAIDGELGEALAEILKEQGMHTISWWESGYRHITNSVKPINSPSDLEGIKLRVPEAQLRIDTFDELGAMPTPMAFSEVFYGLQQNVIDGQENPLATIYDSKFYEVQEHLALTGHIWGSAVLTISESAWNDIPDEYKDIIAEKAEEWKEKEREMIREQDDELVKKLEEAGMKVTQPDVKPFQEIVQSMWSEYEDEFGKELIEIVKQYSSE
ncbi:DctP family TRAP transporter solute-binding subunit [Virgibacillus profundi]|nr:DctP family TRAP transporter solute-binding subunit [Virgibacillus profundi]